MKYIFIVSMCLILSMCSGCTTTQHNIEIKTGKNRVYIPVTINDTTIMMLWDTGASVSFMSVYLANKLGVEYDTSKVIYLSTFLSNTTEGYSYISPIGEVSSYVSDRVKCKIGDSSYSFRLCVSNALKDKDLAVLGDDFMSKFYYAVHLTDQKLSLSTKPLSFADYEITDSVVFCNDGSTTNQIYKVKIESANQIYKVKIESDTLNLLFDSGMSTGERYGNNDSLYWDIPLFARDSTGVTSKVFNDIKKRARADITYYLTGREIKIVYDSVFCVNSYKMISYIPYLVDSSYRADINGYIAYGFIARFDIVYYDPKNKSMTLYKIKDYNSIMQDVPMHEYFKGATVVKE